MMNDECGRIIHHSVNFVTSNDLYYRGWRRPGPMPPGGVTPDEGETLDYISGHFRIFQYVNGHRFSTDDVLTAWYGTQWAPTARRAADLGSGIGSVGPVVALPASGATHSAGEAPATSTP